MGFMDTAFTPSQVLAALMGLCAAIVSISSASAIIVKALKAANSPNRKQNERLDEHERKLREHDEKFEKYDTFLAQDKKRLDLIDEGNKVTQKALLALLGHAIDGNNQDQLESAKESLQDYLINR